MRTQEGRLPDLKVMAQRVREVSSQFSLRGVEATVNGQLVKEQGQLQLRLSAGGEALRLIPLRRKVQWNPQTKQAYPATRQELTAYRSLAAHWQGKPFRVQVTGPLEVSETGAPLRLEVRAFRPNP